MKYILIFEKPEIKKKRYGSECCGVDPKWNLEQRERNKRWCRECQAGVPELEGERNAGQEQLSVVQRERDSAREELTQTRNELSETKGAQRAERAGWREAAERPKQELVEERDAAREQLSVARYAPAELYEPTAEEKASLTERIRAATGGEGRVRVSFGGTAEVNGTYAEQSGPMDGLPYFRNERGVRGNTC